MNPHTLAIRPDETPGRRGFLRRAALTTVPVIAALTGLRPNNAKAVAPALTFADIPGEGDVKVLNYALALEALEADLYSQALMRLTDGGTTPTGERIKGLRKKDDVLKPKTQDAYYYNLFGQVEAQHRDFLDAALGDASLLKSAPFNTAKFDFNMNGLSRKEVGQLVLLAEKTGVGAYLGAIPFLQTRVYLQIAAAIQGTEARHTAVLADAQKVVAEVRVLTAGPCGHAGQGLGVAAPEGGAGGGGDIFEASALQGVGQDHLQAAHVLVRRQPGVGGKAEAPGARKPHGVPHAIGA